MGYLLWYRVYSPKEIDKIFFWMIATFGYSEKKRKRKKLGDIMLYHLPSRFHNKPILTHFKSYFCLAK
jgi:hypothetical protein